MNIPIPGDDPLPDASSGNDPRPRPTMAPASNGIHHCATPPPRFAPACGERVSGSHNSRREHHGGVVLRDNERCPDQNRSQAGTGETIDSYVQGQSPLLEMPRAQARRVYVPPRTEPVAQPAGEKARPKRWWPLTRSPYFRSAPSSTSSHRVTTAIKGAIPNHATKHRKNANQERWKRAHRSGAEIQQPNACRSSFDIPVQSGSDIRGLGRLFCASINPSRSPFSVDTGQLRENRPTFLDAQRFANLLILH